MLDAGHSTHYIGSITGVYASTISRLHSNVVIMDGHDRGRQKVQSGWKWICATTTTLSEKEWHRDGGPSTAPNPPPPPFYYSSTGAPFILRNTCTYQSLTLYSKQFSINHNIIIACPQNNARQCAWYMMMVTHIPTSKECSELYKSSGSYLTKLSPTNIHHAAHLITTRKAENAVQVTKLLKTIINQSLSPTTVWWHLKKADMKAVVKRKCPLLSAKHCKACLNYAHTHKDWTVEDWKRVV